MSLTVFTKVSGVLIVTQTAGLPKYYAATALANGKFSPSSDGLDVNITVGNDNFQIPFGEYKLQLQGLQHYHSL